MSASVLVPLGVGVGALIITLFAVLTHDQRALSGPPPERAAAPTGRTADQPPEPVAPPAAGRAPPRTVADAVAMRAAATAAADRPGESVPRQAARPIEDPPIAPPPAREAAGQALDQPGPATGGANSPSQPSRPPEAGSAQAVADAVAQAFATRVGVAGRPDAQAGRAPAGAEVTAITAKAGRGSPPLDARDRLLAALLDDPISAVGATIELQSRRERLDRLTAAVRKERAVLGAVLRRLAGAGLATDQIVRLSGMPAEEVQELLTPDLPVS